MLQYLIIWPDAHSETAWQSEVRSSLPEQLNDEEVELLVINLRALKKRIHQNIESNESDFTITRASEILDIAKGAIHEWLKRGFLIPSIRAQSGRGKAMLFSLQDLYKLALFKNINDRGLIRSAATALIKHLDFRRTVMQV